jgi:Sensors of blue-light using FAD
VLHEQKFLQLPEQLCMISAMEYEITGHELLWETIRQREEYPIFRLTYVSCAVEMLTDADLDDIESKSLVANDARDVTGLLIINGRRILQILEGRESAVLELYEKIRKDPRHVIAKLVSTVEDEGRMLLTWNMVVRDVGSIPEDVLNQYNELYDELLHAKEPRIITIDDVDFLKSVALLSVLPA